MVTVNKNSHCGFCGSLYTTQDWPRYCTACCETTWRNPLPVTAVMARVIYSGDSSDDGLVIIKRAIEPHIGEWALPGGYLDVGETWEQGALRELFEETGIDARKRTMDLELVELVTSPINGNLLIFCTIGVLENELPKFIDSPWEGPCPYPEVSDVVVAREPMNLAFPTHTKNMQYFFQGSKY